MMKKRNLPFWISTGLCILLIFLVSLPSTKGGEYKYDNYYWLSTNLNLSENDFSSIAYLEDWDQIVAISSENKIYTKKSYENQWNPIVYDESLSIESVILDPAGRIILQSLQQLLIKDRFDLEWKAIELPMKRVAESKIQILSIADLNLIVLVQDKDIWTYADKEWQKIPNPNELLIQTMVYASEQKLLFVGTFKNGLWTVDWETGEQKKVSMQPFDCSVVQIYFPVNSNNASFATTTQGELYRSLDQGQIWEKISVIGEKNPIFNFCEDETRSGVFFAFTKLGVFLTSDNGSEWIPMQHGIENVETKAGCFLPSEQKFYIATQGKGIRISFLIPNQPSPINPKDGEDVFYFKPTLSWNLFGGNNLPGSYHVVVSLSKDFDEIVFDKLNIMGDSTLVPENTLKLHTPYFWKVRVETQYWFSDWSMINSFIVRQKWVFAPNQSKFQWNEKKITFSEKELVEPYIDRGIFYLPVRSFMESIGALVDWNSQQKEILIQFKGKNIILPLHSTKYPLLIKQKRAFISIRFLKDFYGWNLSWDSLHRVAILKELK